MPKKTRPPVPRLSYFTVASDRESGQVVVVEHEWNIPFSRKEKRWQSITSPLEIRDSPFLTNIRVVKATSKEEACQSAST